MKATRALALAILAFATSTARAALPDTIHLSGFESCNSPALYCADVDQDGYGDDGYCLTTCEPPYDFAALPTGDCNNDDPLINPAPPRSATASTTTAT